MDSFTIDSHPQRALDMRYTAMSFEQEIGISSGSDAEDRDIDTTNEFEVDDVQILSWQIEHLEMAVQNSD